MDNAGDRETFEQRFSEFGARVDRLLETAQQSELFSRVKSELEVWREWLDEARVQRELGTMEARERIEKARSSLERLYSRVKKRVEEFEGISEPPPGLAEAVRTELEKAKDDLASPEGRKS